MAESAPAVHGTCDERFLAVKQKLAENLASGRDLGASICVNIDGTNVVDIWGGYADASRSKPWEENTITNIWSTSKNVTSLAALLLIERGQLDPEAPVSKYWPAFATNGKEKVLVRHLLSHASGLSGWQEKVTYEDIYDLHKSTTLLEQQAPWWEPGTQTGYHAVTMGHLVSGVVERITGQTLKAFIASELAGPLGADFQVGAAEADWARAAEIIPPPPTDWSNTYSSAFHDTTSPAFKTFANPPLDATRANTPGWRKAQIPAANGFSNARGVVRILSPISLGGSVDGQKFLSPATVDRIFATQITGIDAVLGNKVRFGLGFGISATEDDGERFLAWVPRGGKVAAWGGWGGSLAIMDVGRRVTISYVMNRMEDTLGEGAESRGLQYVQRVYEALGVTM